MTSNDEMIRCIEASYADCGDGDLLELMKEALLESDDERLAAQTLVLHRRVLSRLKASLPKSN